MLGFSALSEAPLSALPPSGASYTIDSNISITSELTADASKGLSLDNSSSITSELTADASLNSSVSETTLITALLSASASVTMYANSAVVTSASLTSDALLNTNINAQFNIIASQIADASKGSSIGESTDITVNSIADVSKGISIGADTTEVTVALSGNILKGRVANALFDVNTTLTADALRTTTGQTNTSVEVGLTIAITKRSLIGSILNIVAGFITKAKFSNPVTDHDVDTTIILADNIWTASLDAQPWAIVDSVFVLEASLDPAIDTYASLDVDSNYYTLANNLWEVTI
jgi:hypothetical protein